MIDLITGKYQYLLSYLNLNIDIKFMLNCIDLVNISDIPNYFHLKN